MDKQFGEREYDRVPGELKELPQWVVRRGKIPIDPRTGRGAKAGRPETWVSFREAVEASSRYDGIGFEFREGGGIVGIDLDTVRDPATGYIAPEALDIINTLESYTEISPSGYGFHIYIQADIVLPWNKVALKDNGIERFETDKNGNHQDGKRRRKTPELEVYHAGRYFTVTGDRYGDKTQVGARRGELMAVLAYYGKQGVAQEWLSRGLEKDTKLKSLWDGYRASGDESSNDMALMNKLAYWCNRDPAQMVAAFTASPFYAQKDDKHHKKAQRPDYLLRTAQIAIQDCRSIAWQDNKVYREKCIGGEVRKQASSSAFPGKDFLACFKPLHAFVEEEATWLVPGWMPEGQITLLAADGGTGKTTTWCDLAVAVSSGGTCLLDPPGYHREPGKVAFLTTEDSVRKKLKRRLRLAGANESNIITPDFLEDKEGLLRDLKFGSPKMEEFIRYFKPALCIFDPVQGFIPPDVNMGSRNAMRDCMAPLVALGEECGTSFLVVCHTNKRKGASGRDRIADSADLWDVSRSVIMAGYTDQEGVRYLSNEKNNYSPLQETALFTIGEDGKVQSVGTTWKRDREFMQAVCAEGTKPKREDCKEFILAAVDGAGGCMRAKELEEAAIANGYSKITLRRAKEEMRGRELEYYQEGYHGTKTWYIKRRGYIELPSDFPTPFNTLRQAHQDDQMKLKT